MSFLFLLVLTTPVWVRAEPILFRAAEAPELEYRARLRSEEALRTPTQAYLAQHPLAAARELLLTRFARAQTAFLNNAPGEARRHFQEVVALVPSDDWRASERALFLHAYLRLAQLENGSGPRDHWLEQARYLGPGLAVETDLFPPPLVTRYQEMPPGRTITPDPHAQGWPLMLINGVPCRPNDCPRFPAGEGAVRVTFLSDQWQPHVVEMDLAALTRLRPPRQPWVEGSCARGGLSPAARALGNGSPFFGLSCEPGLGPRASARSPRLADLSPQMDVSAPSPDATRVNFPAPPSRRPIYKSPWLWAGVGAVALAAVALAVQSSGRHHDAGSTPGPVATPAAPGENSPTITYGR